MISNVALSTPVNEILYSDNSAGNSVNSIKAAPSTLYWITCDNTQNSVSTFVRIWDATSGSITNGTSAPNIVLYVPGSTIMTFNFQNAAQPGLNFTTALSISAVQEAGQVGATSPPSAVTITVSYI